MIERDLLLCSVHPIFPSTCTSKAMTFSSQQAAGTVGMLAGGTWGCVPGFERGYTS